VPYLQVEVEVEVAVGAGVELQVGLFPACAPTAIAVSMTPMPTRVSALEHVNWPLNGSSHFSFSPLA
jgi:hypothetical protein